MLYNLKKNLRGGPPCLSVDAALSTPNLEGQLVQVIGHVAPSEDLVKGPFEPRKGVVYVIKVYQTTSITGRPKSQPIFTAKSGANFKISDTLGLKSLLVDVQSSSRWLLAFKPVNEENNIELKGDVIMSGGEHGHKLQQKERPEAREFMKFFMKSKGVVMQDKNRHGGFGRLLVASEEVLSIGDPVAVVGVLQRSADGLILVAGANALITNDEQMVGELKTLSRSLGSGGRSCKINKMIHKPIGMRPAPPGLDEDEDDEEPQAATHYTRPDNLFMELATKNATEKLGVGDAQAEASAGAVKLEAVSSVAEGIKPKKVAKSRAAAKASTKKNTLNSEESMADALAKKWSEKRQTEKEQSSKLQAEQLMSSHSETTLECSRPQHEQVMISSSGHMHGRLRDAHSLTEGDRAETCAKELETLAEQLTEDQVWVDEEMYSKQVPLNDPRLSSDAASRCIPDGEPSRQGCIFGYCARSYCAHEVVGDVQHFHLT